MMDERIEQITSEMSAVADDARAAFGSLSYGQLNWKPAENSWSVGQCLDHIILTNQKFYPEFDRMAAGNRQNSFWEQWSPFSNWAGRFLITAVSVDSKKAKTPSKSLVPPSEIAADIVSRFVDHIAEVNRKVQAVSSVDRKKTIVTSPFLAVFTYRLDDALTVLVEHTKRHVRQAKRVTITDGFPKT